MILGHEVAGHVAALGPDVSGLAVGDLVAVSPSRPCGACATCLQGLPNHCLNMRFYGSAMPFPHIQGAFRQMLVADAVQCIRADGLSAGEAAMAEPLAVALHAVGRAGEVLGRRVLVTGCGPIGQLVILAARRAGAAEIVATDLADFTLAVARGSGADRVINASDSAAMQEYATVKGYFDIHIECSGAPQALIAGIAAVKPRGVVVQLGIGPAPTLPLMPIIAREIDLRGSFRFHGEFATAVTLMQRRLIDVAPLITHTMSLTEAEDAFRAASDRNRAMKAQIDFA